MKMKLRTIYEKAISDNKEKLQFEDDWDHLRNVWAMQDKALEGVGESEKNALVQIVSSILSAKHNQAFSPATILCAMLALGNICDGETRKEILSALSCREEYSLTMYENIFNSVVGSVRRLNSSISMSLWMSDMYSLKEKEIRHFCKQYDADAFCGRMGSCEVNAAIQKWVDSHTGNMLSEYSSEIQTDFFSVMELLTASYFKACWIEPFWETKTKLNRFYIDKRNPVMCKFMYGVEDADVHFGEHYLATSKSLPMDFEMWFMLPNEDVDLHSLTADPTVIDFIVDPSAFDLQKYRVSLTVPKFDVSDKIDLKSVMQSMGINKVFDRNKAQFTVISNSEEFSLSKADHATRVKITEEGVEAASFVDFGIAAAGLPPELKSISIKLDRPFLLAITKNRKIPVYVGVVVNPAEE